MANLSGARCLGFSNTGGPWVSMECTVLCACFVVNDCAVIILGNCLIKSVKFYFDSYALIEHIELHDSIHRVDKLVILSITLLLRISTIRLKWCKRSAPIIALDQCALMNSHLTLEH